MSLLLEALKRAEDKGRRRQGGRGALPAADPGVLPHVPEAVGAEAAFLDQEDADGSMQPVELVSAPPVDEPAAAWEPELAPTSRPAALAAEAARQGAGRAPATAAVRESPGDVPRPAPGRARSADRLLQAQARPGPSRRRQILLLAVVVVLAAGVSTLWFWPDDPPPLARRPPSQVSVSGPLGTGAEPAPAAGLASPPSAQAPAAPTAAAPPAPATAVPPAPAAPEAVAAVAAAQPAQNVGAPLQGTLPAPVSAPAVSPPAAPAPPPPALAAAPVLAVPPTRPARSAAVSPARAAPPAPAAADAPPGAEAASPRQAAAAQLQRQLQQAYTDFQAGRTQEAMQAWREVVRLDPTQRDAWLGLAIAAHRQGQLESAVSGYRQVLRLDPENGEALAALAALGVSDADGNAESRLRDALARNSGSAMLNSALARLLATQSRWDESQPYWFAAHAAAPEQPTHAYNLAVALDRLRKTALAAQYYRKALALQQGRAPAFDEAAARTRLQALEDAARTAAP